MDCVPVFETPACENVNIPNNNVPDSHQGLESVEITRDNSNTMNIIDLNDDCLMQIFLKLQTNDLIATSETCKRFRSTAFAVMPHCAIDIIVSDMSIGRWRGFFMTFGELITNLTVRHIPSYCAVGFCMCDDCPLSCHIYKLVIAYCGSKLTSLSFVHLRLQTHLLTVDPANPDNPPKFKYLKSLTTSNCNLPVTFCEYVKSECKDLIRLDISRNELINHKYPRLESVVFRDKCNSDFPVIYQFVRDNNTLKELHLQLCNRDDEHIANLDPFKNVPKIKVACGRLPMSATFFMPFSRWKHIKSLRTSRLHVGMPSFIHNMVSTDCLQNLELNGILVNNHLINGIAKHTKLRRLHIYQSVKVVNKRYDWKPLVCLRNLTELKIGGQVNIEDEDLVYLAMSMPKLERIDLTFLELENKAKTCEDIAEIRRNRNQPIVVFLHSTVYGIDRWNVEIETDATRLCTKNINLFFQNRQF